jgi:sulfoxide reductase heme-binding subunit YedZ
LVYGVALLAVIHYIWLVKSDVREPLIYGAVLVLLLAVRVPPLRRAITQARYKFTQKRKARVVVDGA